MLCTEFHLSRHFDGGVIQNLDGKVAQAAPCGKCKAIEDNHRLNNRDITAKHWSRLTAPKQLMVLGATVISNLNIKLLF